MKAAEEKQKAKEAKREAKRKAREEAKRLEEEKLRPITADTNLDAKGKDTEKDGFEEADFAGGMTERNPTSARGLLTD